MKDSHDDLLKAAWNAFCSSGRAQDYISFAQLCNSTEKEGNGADADKGSDNQDQGCK